MILRLFLILLISLSCASVLNIEDNQDCYYSEVTLPYERGDYGRWRDEDKDCQDTRQEVLIRDSISEVFFEDERNCRILSGTWIDPYSGEVFTSPSSIEIDHVVALEEAHFSGAALWEKEIKRDFSNDMDNLVASGRSSNRSKGSRDPVKWMPPNPTYRCLYLDKWVFIKTKWSLQLDPIELFFINYAKKLCLIGVTPPLPQN